MKYLLLFITSLFIQVAISDVSQPSVHNERIRQNNDVYLPKNIIPVSYSIRIEPHFYNNTFIGKNKMKLNVKIATNKIVFHSGKNINIILDTITNSRKGVMLITSWFHDEKNEKYVIFVNDTMPAKSIVELTLNFSGTFSQNMNGIYIINYWKYSNLFMANETMLYFLGTHFQPTHARDVFPCFDEPHFKALFTLIIQRPKSFLSFCSLPLFYTVLNNQTATDTYETEIPISTYQISFLLFNSICFDDHQTNVKICTRFQKRTNLLFALEVVGKARNFFSSLFNEDESLSPVTMIGVPDVNLKTTSSNLLTFSENRLFYNSMLTPDINYNKIITTVMYGWTSMWLRHKITLGKWDYAWINEGIATYLSYYAVYDTSLAFNSEQQLIIDHIHPALLEDGTSFAKPLTRRIKSLKEIQLIGDTIIVSKGCSIIRMIQSILGKDVFESALTNYIISRQNKITTLFDFWSSLQKSINKSHLKLPVNLKTIMNSWTNQPGYPVLHVNVKNNTVELRQQRFLYSKLHPISNNIVWWIPLTWISSKTPNVETTDSRRWLYKIKEKINLNISQSDWVIFNIQREGFYRVNYDLQSWSRIFNQLYNHMETIPPITRGMIIDDLFNLARADIIPYTVTLEGILYITQEMEYFPVKTALTGLQYLYERFADEEYSLLFNNFLLRLILPIYEHFDASTNSSSTDVLQAEVNEWVCKLGHKKCHDIMLDHLHKWKNNSNYVIPKNKKSLVYCIAIKHGFLADIISLYFGLDNLIEKNIVIEAFKCISDKSLLTSLLESGINDEKFFFTTKQQTLSMLKAVAQHSNENAVFILEFIAENTVKMFNYFQDQPTIAEIIHTASKVLSTTKNLYKLKSFIETSYTYFNEISISLSDTLDSAISDILFYKKHHQNIVNWINEEKILLWMSKSNYTKATFPMIQSRIRSARNIPENMIHSLRMIQNFSKFNYYIAKQALNFIKSLDDKFSGRYISEFFRHYVSKLIIPMYNKLTFEEQPNESLDDKLLRLEIIKWACLLKNADCEERSRKLFNNWKLNSSATLPVHLRQSILCTVVKEDHDGDWQFLWNEFRNAKFPIEQDAILRVLECAENREKLVEFFKSIPKYDLGQKQILKIFLLVSSSGLTGMEIILDFMLENYKIVNNYFNNENIIDNIFEDLANRVTTRKLLQKYFNCVDLYIKLHPKIYLSLTKYSHKAATELLQFDDTSLKIFKWLCHINSGNIPLPKNIVPTRYDVRLSVPLDSKISFFQGSMNITLNILSDTSYIALHTGNLEIAFVQIYFKNNLTLIPSNGFPQKYGHLYIITLAEVVEAGTQLLVHIAYKRFFNNNPNIFYRSYYIGPDGSQHLFAATQVEKYGARELFPCLDETYFKSKFQLSIKRPNSHYSYTNMVLNTSETHLDGPDTWDYYKVTDTISPNDIYIIITDMVFQDYNVDLEVWLRPCFVTDKNDDFTDNSQIQLKGDAGWIVVDSLQTGFYYVNFNLMTWETLFQSLKQDNFGSISVRDRAQIIDDLYNLAKRNHISLSLFFIGTEYLIHEKSFLPWSIFLQYFFDIWHIVDDPEIHDGLKMYLSELIEPTYQYIGFERKSNDTREIKQLRRLFLSCAIFLNYTDFTNNSLAIFNQWRTNPDNYLIDDILHPYENICNALLNSGFDEWKFVWQYTLTLENNLNRILLIRALACTYNETALNIYLGHIFSTDNWMNDASKKIALSSINGYPRNGFDVTLNFLMKKHMENDLSWSTFSFLLYQMIKDPLSITQVSKFMKFISDNAASISNLDNDFYTVLIDTTEYARWYNSFANDLKLWLINQKFITNFTTLPHISTNRRDLRRIFRQ